MKKVIFACFLILFVACDTATSKKETKSPKEAKPLQKGLVDLSGKSISLSDYKGKKILVNYWATWCGPCKAEMPALLRAQEILVEHNYVFLFPSDESIEKITGFKNKTNYNFNFLKLNGSVSQLGIYALPTTFIYNEKGEKVKEIVGSVVWDSKEMIDLLKNI